MSAIARRVYLQPSTDEIVFHSQQDVGPIFEANAAWMNAPRPSSKLWHSDYVLIGRIPMILLDQWCKLGLKYWVPEDWKIIRRMLNSSEWSKLRTAPGRI